MHENILKLAALQESGELSPATEEAIALAYADRHERELRYVAAWSRWMCHDGTRWSADDTLRAFDRARAICREVALDCEKATTAAAIASARTVAAVVRLAAADRRLAATVAQWDSEAQLFNAGTQTYDLRTGIARAPDPSDYLTKAAGCSAAPRGTPHPRWAAFLARITRDDEGLQQFLQRYVGYCCSGFTGEHVFAFAYGTGANGKSTFINTIARIFGDYATVADMATFIASRTERHPTDLAKLCGARLVVAQETQQGRRWDETKIKALTGGDRITARFMRQDFFDFVPALKLFIAGNHKPRLGNVDEAMRRRMLLVPFTVQIPPAERDQALPDKLWAERAAILRWCLDGCLEWQRIGLAPPAAVLDATTEYFAEQDAFGQWLEDRTEDGGPLAFARISELFSSWKQWCEDRNLKPGTATGLSDALADRGHERKREGGTGQRGFARLTVKRG